MVYRMLQSGGYQRRRVSSPYKDKFVDPKAKSPSDVKAAQKPVSRIGLIPKLTLKTHFKRSRSVDRPEVLSAIMPSEVKMQRPWSRIPTYRLLPSKSQEGTAFSGLRRDRDEYEERTISLPPTKKARMQWRPAYQFPSINIYVLELIYNGYSYSQPFWDLMLFFISIYYVFVTDTRLYSNVNPCDVKFTFFVSQN